MRSGITIIGLLLVLFIFLIVMAVIISTIAKIAWIIMTSKVVLVLVAIVLGYLFLKKCFGT